MFGNFFSGRKKFSLEQCVINNDVISYTTELNRNMGLDNHKLAQVLILAAQYGRSNMIQMLLDRNVEIVARDENGCNALMWAIRNNHNFTVRLLLKYSNELIESKDNNGRTPLIYAVQYNNVEALKFLLKNEVDFFARDDLGRSALTCARQSKAQVTADNLNNYLIALLLDAASNQDISTIDSILLDDSLDLEDKIGNMTLLMHCAVKNYEELAIRILAKGANLNAITWYKNFSVNSLIIAAFNRNSSIVRILLNTKANPDIQIGNGQTALMIAAKNNDLSTLECLLLANANKSIRDKRGWTALIHSASAGHLDSVVRLIESGNTNTQGVFASLRVAFENQNFEIVNYLISTCHNLYDNGWPMILHVVNLGHIGLIKMLIDAGVVDLNATNQDGLTPLMCAAMNDNIAIVQELLLNQANPRIKNKYGNDALMLSASTSCIDGIEIIELLLAHGASPSEYNNDGMSALMISASSSYKESIHIVEILIANGADIHFVNKNGQTALKLAKSHNNIEVENLLQQCSTDSSIKSHLIKPSIISKLPENSGRHNECSKEEEQPQLNTMTI